VIRAFVRGLGLLVAAAIAPRLGAQDIGFAEYYRQVRTHHPVARQAQLAFDAAAADVRGAYGAFEPVLSAAWDAKTFGGKRYYDDYVYTLTLPTPLGVDMKFGYERSSGTNVNPESVTPSSGLLTAGLSIPLGQRMITDERRNALSVARALRDAAAGERTAALNKLLLTAAKDFAAWYEADRRAAIAREGVALAEFRLGAVRSRVRNGDVPAIDTIEATLEVERRSVTRLEAEAAAYAARLAASAHLWDANSQPVDIAAGTRPAGSEGVATVIDSLSLARWLDLAERRHPDLAKLAAKVRQSEAQRSLTAQALLPLVSLDISSITARSDASFNTNGDNWKGGLSAKVAPLLIKDRAKFSSAGAKLDRDRIEYVRVKRDVSLEIRANANTLAAIDAQAERQARAVTQARALRDGEQRRYEAGESSLLLVNIRERTLLDEDVKLAALQAKRVSARAALAVAIGDPAAVAF
jgi:outer membrane protein TolC